MTNPALRFLEGGKTMGAAIAEHPWHETPLGPVADWPPVLKIAVSMMINSAYPKSLCWGDSLTTIYNDAFIPILGNKHPALGQPFTQVWSEVQMELGPIASRALSGEAVFVEDFELELERSGAPETAYLTFCYSPVRDENGVVRGMLNTVVETTGKIRAERLATLRNGELVHRYRNALALISGLIRQTHRNATSLEEAQKQIQARLAALVGAQDVLTQSGVSEAPVGKVVERALAPFGANDGAIGFSGPHVLLGSDQVASLSLGLHELATNAAKYGALTTPEGRVTVSWSVERQDGVPMFQLTWTEEGGPPVQKPVRRGFGTSVIEIALARSLDAEVKLTYPQDGLRFQLRARVDRLRDETAA